MNEFDDKYEIEPSFSVYDNTEGVRIKVGVSPDFPENILISTPSDKDKEWYGNVRLDVSKEHARKIADAIYKQLDAMEK